MSNIRRIWELYTVILSVAIFEFVTKEFVTKDLEHHKITTFDCSGADLEILGRVFLTIAIQWSSNFTAIFDNNYKFLPSIDLEKFYEQLIKNFEMEGVSGNPRNPLKPPLLLAIC